MENKTTKPIAAFLKKNKICPVCIMKKIASATKVTVNGADRFDNGVALTPPMGWASWNLFRHNINENLIKEMAKAMHDTHLDELGYQYINVDDCWMSSYRTADGKLQSDKTTFPSGIKALVEAVNSYGLKMGIYTSNGTLTCEGLPSSLYHERTDAEAFAEWGVEYFKYDFCHNEPIPTTAPEIDKIMIANPKTGEEIVIQAETAQLIGDAVVLEDKKLTSTGKYVSGLDASHGSMVFHDIEFPEDGEYVFTIGLRKFGNYRKYAEIVVNGVDTYPITIPSYKCFTREGRHQINVNFKAGKNTIMIHNPVASRMDSAAKQYRNMGKELQRATKLVAEREGREEKPICYSICEWGYNQPWKWGASAGNLWRTTKDIMPHWASIIAIYEFTVRLAKYARPGNWNDPDMLEVGNGNLTDNENRAHFSLWCMMAAPLILGNDIRTFLDENGNVDETNKVYKIISNKAVIAIDQDKLGVQARRVKTNGLVDVLVKPLENKELAVCILNKGPKAMKGSFSIKELTKESFVDLPLSDKYTVIDLWSDKSFVASDTITEVIEPHSVILYRIKTMS